jgi:hypothetical protein
VGDSIYRVSAPKPPVPPDPYLLAWASLRRRRMAMWISWFAWLPIGAVVMPLLGRVGQLVVFLDLAAFVMSGHLIDVFRCPHCREAFAKKSILASRCFSCGISVGTPRSAVVAPNAGPANTAT